MSQICLITQDHPFARWLSAELRSDLDCSLSYDMDFDFQGTENFDIVILDLIGNSQPAVHFLEQIRRKKTDQAIIGLVQDKKRFFLEATCCQAIDEVFERPEGLNEMGQIKKALFNKIAILVRLADLQEKLRHELRQSQIVAKSQAMRAIMQRLPQLAETMATVLITGETGTGKELIARSIHYLGPRAGGPFVTIDCSAIPENLVENELFGHVRGAYTDAGPSTKGMIEEADGGTLFLDEIESLPLGVQSKFLRFLQERQFKPLGNARYISVDVRVVAATNTDLAQAIQNNRFRQDLYYRLNVLPLFIPPLRQRKEDIPALVTHFIQLHTGDNPSCDPVPEVIMQSWQEHSWPGNVRELENTVQQWLMNYRTEDVSSTAISDATESPALLSLAEIREGALTQAEQVYFKKLMAHTQGNISLAARIANIDRKSLGILLKKRGIDVNQYRS